MSNYKTRTLQVSYDGSTWDFTRGRSNEGSDPTEVFSKPTYLYFVAVGNSLTFDATNPVTWTKGAPKDCSTSVINNGCLLIINPDKEKKNTRFPMVLNMIYNGVTVSSPDPIIVNKPKNA